MSKQRKHYEAAFKLEVARMIVDQGMSVAQVVKDMNIGRTAVCHWIEQYRTEQQGKPGIGKPLTIELQRIRQLETENRQLRSDDDVFLHRALRGQPIDGDRAQLSHAVGAAHGPVFGGGIPPRVGDNHCWNGFGCQQALV